MAGLLCIFSLLKLTPKVQPSLIHVEQLLLFQSEKIVVVDFRKVYIKFDTFVPPKQIT